MQNGAGLSWKMAKQVVAGQLQVGAAAAEQPREELLDAGIDLIEGLFEPRAGFTIDLADGRLQGLQGAADIGVLRIEIAHALGLFLEFVDGGEVDVAEAGDAVADAIQLRGPGLGVGAGVDVGEDRLWALAFGLELFFLRLASDQAFLALHALAIEGAGRLGDGLLGAMALLLPLPHGGIEALHGVAGLGELALDVQPECKLLLQPLSLVGDRLGGLFQ
jgi:hypothetical protein